MEEIIEVIERIKYRFREDRSSRRKEKDRRGSNRNHSLKRTEEEGHKKKKISRDEERFKIFPKDRPNRDRGYSRDREFKYKEGKSRSKRGNIKTTVRILI